MVRKTLLAESAAEFLGRSGDEWAPYTNLRVWGIEDTSAGIGEDALDDDGIGAGIVERISELQDIQRLFLSSSLKEESWAAAAKEACAAREIELIWEKQQRFTADGSLVSPEFLKMCRDLSR